MQDTPVERMRALAGELREETAALADLEDRIRDRKARIRAITTSEMVDLMHQMDINSFEINGDGNLPPLVFEMGNHYAASIPQDWEEARREHAFNLIPDELLKIEVIAVFAKGEAQLARDLADELVTAGYTIQMKKGVHHSTLKAWLREQFENGQQLPDLEQIGASIFNEVKVKEKRDD